MAAVTICSDFGTPLKRKAATVSAVSVSILHEVMGPDAIICFLNLELKPKFSLSSFIFHFYPTEIRVLMASPTFPSCNELGQKNPVARPEYLCLADLWITR